MKPRILLLNDDGITAPGIKHLFRAIRDYTDCQVVAPTIEKSGAGLSMTLRKPLKISKVSWEDHPHVWTVTGTPADCVKLALNSLLKTPPDLIVSGINRGSNAGRNVLYSGTIGGVIEGLFRNNIPGIAFSSHDYANPCFEKCEKFIFPIIKHFLQHPLPNGSFVNVNFPSFTKGNAKGIKFARQGKGFWTDNPDQRVHPEGEPYFWLGGQWKSFEELPNSDVALLEKGYVTVVPIHIDELTDHDHLNSHRMLFEDTFDKLHKEDFAIEDIL